MSKQIIFQYKTVFSNSQSYLTGSVLIITFINAWINDNFVEYLINFKNIFLRGSMQQFHRILLSAVIILASWTSLSYAGDCFRVGPMATPDDDSPISCEQMKNLIEPVLEKIPDLPAISKFSKEQMDKTYGKPYKELELGTEIRCYYEADGGLGMVFDGVSGKAQKISFNIAGVTNVEEIPSILKLGPPLTPIDGPVGNTWLDLAGFKQLVAMSPDYKYNGELIYPITLYIDKTPFENEAIKEIGQHKKAKN